MPLLSTNPATGKPIREHTPLAEADAHAALRETAEAQRHWRLTPPTQRTALCNTLQNHLRQRREALAHLITEEMGKPITESREEVEQCAELCGWLAANLAEALRPEIRDADGTRHCIHYIPAGVVLGVLPWNYPLWQVFRAAAPAIAAGNGFALKHASTVQQTAAAAEALFAQAGFPPSLLRNLPVTSALVPSLIAHPAVTAVTVTGSTAAGKVIAAEAAGRIKKTVLELGGSDAYIILEDADLDRAAETCAAARLVNCGQSCIAAKRFIVVEAVADAFRDRFSEALQRRRPGDPREESTRLGPVARADARDQLHDQVRRSLEAGAELVCGGEPLAGPGFFYPPTLLDRVEPGMPAFDEEVFGPVAALVRVADEPAAVAAANRSAYGIGAAVFTADLSRGERLLTQDLNCGVGALNRQVLSSMDLPFGGTRQSGYGRELGLAGLREFLLTRSISLPSA